MRSLRLSTTSAPAHRAPAATSQRAIRSKRGHQKAQAPGRDRIGPKHSRPICQQLRLGIGGQSARIAADEFVERLVDRDAELGPAGIGIELVERLEPEDVAGVDRIGVAQPGLDLGDRQLARARGERRARRGRRQRPVVRGWSISSAGRRRSRARPSAPSSPTARSTASSRNSQRDGTVGTPSLPRGAGQRHLRRADRLGKIVRGDADRALRHGDAEFLAHLPRHPRVVAGRARARCPR